MKIRLRIENGIEEATNKLISFIQSAITDATPVSSFKMTRKSTMSYPLRELVVEKKKACRRWQESRIPNNKTIFVRSHIVKFKKLLITSSSLIWRHCYLLQQLTIATKRIKHPILHIPPLRTPDCTWARSDKQKATVFANHLEKVFQPNPIEFTIDFSSPELTSDTSLRIQLVTLLEVTREIDSLTPHKSSKSWPKKEQYFSQTSLTLYFAYRIFLSRGRKRKL